MINARFEGQLDCARLIIGEYGHFTGHAEADEAEIAGLFVGELIASKVILKPTAHVEATVRYLHLSSDREAIFIGDFEKQTSVARSNAYRELVKRQQELDRAFDQDA